jgi:hypothetical protein
MKNIRSRLLNCILAVCISIFSACAHPSHMIEGPGISQANDMSEYLIMKNSRIDRNLANEIALIYLEEARAENINQDVAFAQMCIETGFLSYGGTASAEQFNFCGLGVFNSQTKGESFSDMRLGVRAHIQHLKAYASTSQPVNEIVDPRFKYVKRGSAIYVFQLTGKWATDPAYGTKVDRITAELEEYSRQNRINR